MWRYTEWYNIARNCASGRKHIDPLYAAGLRTYVVKQLVTPHMEIIVQNRQSHMNFGHALDEIWGWRKILKQREKSKKENIWHMKEKEKCM